MNRFSKVLGTLAVCGLLISGSAEAGTFADLKTLIENAQAGGEITLSEDYTIEGTATSLDYPDGLVIDKNLTIHGAGHAVDANGVTRVFKIADGVNASFDNITATQGGSAASGGGFYIGESANVYFSKTKITKCGTVQGVHTQNGGAGFFIESKANVTFVDGEISDNTGTDRAGGVYMRGNVVFKNTLITRNSSGSRGGGVYVDPGTSSKRGGEWGGNVRMYNCTVSDNKGGRGGGVYVNSENEKLNYFENCTISGNDVSDNKKGATGGIQFYTANGKMVNCTIVNNKAKSSGGVNIDLVSNLEMVNCTVANNEATVNGGGVYAADGSYGSDYTSWAAAHSGEMKPVGVLKMKGCIVVGNKNSNTGELEDFSVHYTETITDTEATPEITYQLNRYDGKFVSEGYNVIGKIMDKPEGVSEEPVTVTETDVTDAAAEKVLEYADGAPALKDNGGDVYTVAALVSGAAHNLIPVSETWVPSTDARGDSRPSGGAYEAGAFEIQQNSSSGGCNAGTFPLVLLALCGLAVIKKSR